MTDSNTQFAPAKRLENDEVYSQTIKILGLRSVIPILDNLPNMVVILNNERQVIFANKVFTAMIGMDQFESALGQRPGELINCIHSQDFVGGCGTSKNCMYCGAVLTVLKVQETSQREENEAKIVVSVDGKESVLDLHVVAMPLFVDSERFIIAIMTDIGGNKRRDYLERTFLHDLVNSTWALSTRIEFFPRDGLNEIQEAHFEKIKEEMIRLQDEIQAQKDLIAIENMDLKPELAEINVQELLESCMNTVTAGRDEYGNQIQINNSCAEKMIKTDERLLRRAIINLLKNAVEANGSIDSVTIGCRENKKDITIWIKNKTTMPENIKIQIFQRSFTTKGPGRGLGTYSAKLIVEYYLEGKINFESEEGKGTTFFITLKK